MTEAPMRRFVVGTAGHVDHGKTALVRALTGVDCDRLDVEKKRGITIELGFAAWQVDADMRASIIDVPGHERFVRTMVAGAGGLDAVMLLVAADDGVMPQTLEHLSICQLLGVQRGVVVISKADLVDAELLELVTQDVQQNLAGTFLEDAALVVCSAHRRQGLDLLTQEMRSLLQQAPAPPSEGPVFLSIDRHFHKAGFGNVVTGTLRSGSLHVGDRVDLVPGPRGQLVEGLRVRGLRVQEEEIEQALAGQRVAINLRGDGVGALRRGAAVVSPGWQVPCTALSAEIQLLASAPELVSGAELALHLGAADVLVRAEALGQRRVAPGSTALLRLIPREPIAAYAGQRLVLRQPGRHGLGTIGGGRVLDPHPAPGKGSYARWQRVAQALQGPDLRSRVLALIQDARDRGLSLARLQQRLPPGEQAQGVMQQLQDEDRVVRVDRGGEPWFIDGQIFADLGRRLEIKLQHFHEQHPLRLGLSVAELQGSLPELSAWLVERALQRMAQRGPLLCRDHLYALAEVVRRQEDKQRVLQQLAQSYSDQGLQPGSDEQVRQSLGLDATTFTDALLELKRQKQLVRLSGLHFHTRSLAAIRAHVEQHLQQHGELRPADLKELGGGLSRKYAIPLLEWLDAQGVTLRKGDVRVARGGRPANQ